MGSDFNWHGVNYTRADIGNGWRQRNVDSLLDSTYVIRTTAGIGCTTDGIPKLRTPPATSPDTIACDKPENTSGGETKMRRLVQMLVVDGDERLPDDVALLYFSAMPFVTSATDEELYFEIDLQRLVTEHNAKRATIKDEDESREQGRDVFLEPIKIRDLDKRVNTVARF